MTDPAAEACYFGPMDRPLFGWLHQPAGTAAQIGLVICNPFGYEAICAHRSLKHFARTAAENGFAALRFDYDGTGDSAGDDFDADRMAAWIGSIEAAVAHIRAATGVSHVVLLGVRLGATLGMLAAERVRDLAGIVTIAPVARGRLLLRELKALQIAMNEAPPETAADDVEEFAGFPMTLATRTSITQVDLSTSLQSAPPNVLLLDRNDRPKSTELVAALERCGSKVTVHSVPGFVEMMLDAHETVVPTEMISLTMEWLRSLPLDAAAPRSNATGEFLIRHSANFTVGIDGVVEEKHFVGEGARLFGIVTRPAGNIAPKRAVLLLNAGAVHHVGPNRWYVELARRLATAGLIVVRADLSGIGDSGTRPGAAENVVYSDRAVDDVLEISRFVREKYSIEDLQSLGLCAGAYHSLKAALQEHYSGIVVINPLTFFWKEGMSLEFPNYAVTSEARRYKAQALQLASWIKLVRGRVNLRETLRIVGKRLASLLRSQWRNVARAVGLPLADDLGGELKRISRRPTHLAFIFADTDPGNDMLELEGGLMVGRLRRHGGLTVDIVPHANHTFTSRVSRGELTRAVLRVLDVREHAACETRNVAAPAA